MQNRATANCRLAETNISMARRARKGVETTQIIIIVAVIIAIKVKSILDILLYSYNFWSPVILVPLVLTLLGVKQRKGHFLAGAAAGCVGVLVWNFVLHTPGGVDGLIIGIACNLAVTLIARALSHQVK